MQRRLQPDNLSNWGPYPTYRSPVSQSRPGPNHSAEQLPRYYSYALSSSWPAPAATGAVAPVVCHACGQPIPIIFRPEHLPSNNMNTLVPRIVLENEVLLNEFMANFDLREDFVMPDDPAPVPQRSTPNRLIGRPVTIPQREYRIRVGRRSFASSQPINFIMEDGRNISVRNALNHSYTGLIDRDNDRMFPEGVYSIYMRLEWPGYEPWFRQIRTSGWDKHQRPVSKAKLATEIAKSLDLFLAFVTDEDIDPAYAQWRIGPGYINVNNLVLVALHQVSKASWQPVLALQLTD